MASSSLEVKDILFIIYGRQYSYVINAVDKSGNRMSQFKLFFGTYPYAMGFAGVGSRLYMIGGHNSAEEIQRHGESYSLDVHIIDIAVSSSFAKRDPKTLTFKGPRLNGRKITPISFVIKDSIYTISSFFRLGDDDVPAFEVLHASSPSTWVVLPNPPIDRRCLWDGTFINIESYACTNDRYIIISVPKEGGVYMFDVTESRWSHVRMDPLPFLGNAVSKFDGGKCEYYAFTRHCQAGDYMNGLYVFDKLTRDSNQELEIRGAPSEIVVRQQRALAIIGETFFVVRCGFARHPGPGKRANHTMTVDCFEVSKKFGGEEGNAEYVAVNAKDISFFIEKNVTWAPAVFLYCVPLSLRVDT